ncbi:uncharacterized protein LOC117244434 [Parus major]|uniref:uncharacterized protein LOC117244434 n=1 Tax=Parus major TaxID=9157 RepID=UPI001443B557|nr:uncharacterized protein LOC117244434 [Parus major]
MSGRITLSLPALSPRVPLLLSPAAHCSLRWTQFHSSFGSRSVIRGGPATLGPRFGLQRPFLVPPAALRQNPTNAGAGPALPPLPAAPPPPARGKPHGGASLGQLCLCLLGPWRLRVSFVCPDTPRAAVSVQWCCGPGTERSVRSRSHGAAAGPAPRSSLPPPSQGSVRCCTPRSSERDNVPDTTNNWLRNIWIMNASQTILIPMRKPEILLCVSYFPENGIHAAYSIYWTVFVK